MSLRNYYDLFVFPDSEEDIHGIVEYAVLLELKAVAIAQSFESPEDVDKFRKKLRKLLRGVSVKPKIYVAQYFNEENPQILNKKINRFYRNADLLIVQGGVLSINRFCFENNYVDVLLDPHEGRNDSGMDHVMAKLGKENNTTLAISFKPYLYKYGIPIHKITQKIQRNLMLANKYGLNTIIVSNASNKWELRAGRDLASLGYVANLSLERTIKLTSENPEKLVHLIKKRSKSGYINENIEIIE